MFSLILITTAIMIMNTEAISCYGGRAACFASCQVQNCATGYCVQNTCVCSRCGTGKSY